MSDMEHQAKTTGSSSEFCILISEQFEIISRPSSKECPLELRLETNKEDMLKPCFINKLRMIKSKINLIRNQMPLAEDNSARRDCFDDLEEVKIENLSNELQFIDDATEEALKHCFNREILFERCIKSYRDLLKDMFLTIDLPQYNGFEYNSIEQVSMSSSANKKDNPHQAEEELNFISNKSFESESEMNFEEEIGLEYKVFDNRMKQTNSLLKFLFPEKTTEELTTKNCLSFLNQKGANKKSGSAVMEWYKTDEINSALKLKSEVTPIQRVEKINRQFSNETGNFIEDFLLDTHAESNDHYIYNLRDSEKQGFLYSACINRENEQKIVSPNLDIAKVVNEVRNYSTEIKKKIQEKIINYENKIFALEDQLLISRNKLKTRKHRKPVNQFSVQRLNI